MNSFAVVDWVVIGFYFSILAGIAIWVMTRKQKNTAMITVALTGAYTVLGGMRAVVYTETMQTIVLVLGAATLTIVGLNAAGGWTGVKTALEPGYLDMWRPASDPDFPWPSLVITSTIVGMWYWCTDQYIVQRVLAARNIQQGRRGTICSLVLSFLRCPLYRCEPGYSATV